MVLLFGGAGLVLYLAIFTPRTPGQDQSFWGNLPIIGGGAPVGGEPTPTPTAAPTPVESDHPLLQIAAKEIIAPTTALNNQGLLYVLRENGRVASSDLDGNNEKILTEVTLPAIYEALWSPKKDRIAMFYNDGGTIKQFINGVATGTVSKFLPQETISFDWSPDGQSIGYLARRGSNTSLITADVMNKNPLLLYTTPIPDLTLRWISKKTILLVSRPSGLAPSLVISFDLGLKKAKVLFSGRNGLTLNPSPNGAFLLISETSGKGQLLPLTVYDVEKAIFNRLNITTLAEKCSFAGDLKKLYCAIPKNTPNGPMPDKWYMGAAAFSDRIVEVDLGTNQTIMLMEDEADIDAVLLFTSTDGRHLFFQDKKTNTLWRIVLAKDATEQGR